MPLRILLFLAVMTLPLRGAEPAAPATNPESAGYVTDPDWPELFAALANHGAVHSQFTERRWFRLRKQPVELTGEMRLMPDLGLSLHYHGDNRTVVLDAQGVVLRDARGRTRELKPDDRAPPVSSWLLPILRFDLPALREAFEIRGLREEARWTLQFVPRNDDQPKGVGTIILHGIDQKLMSIELRPKADLRIEITIGETKSDIVFSPEDLQRFFR